MLYENINEIVKGIYQYRGLVTIYDVKEMPHTTISEKMEVLIRCKKIINGLVYGGIELGLDKVEELNEMEYQQSLSSCVTYANKNEIVVGFFFKLYKMLICDLNCYYPEGSNKQILSNIIMSDEIGEARNFDKSFKITTKDEDKIIREERKQCDGTHDIDWKVSLRRVKNMEGELTISDRGVINKLKKVELISIIKYYINSGEINKGLKEIFDGLEKIQGQKRMPAMRQIVTAIAFNKPFTQYPNLRVTHSYMYNKNK